jgi:AcrR family transcriptional regulator
MSHMTPSQTRTQASAAERPLRADAERNRRRILDAAAELFAERGLHVSLDEVAERAGVGVGTVYRRFADRDELVDALLQARVEEFLAMVEEAAANPDPWEGLVGFIEQGAEFHGRNRAIKELMFSASGSREWVDRVRARVRPKVGAMVKAAKEQGKLREDLHVLDVPMLELMLAGAIDFTRDAKPEIWRRMLGIVIDGLRADRRGPTPLGVKPMGPKELDQAMEREGRSAARARR